MSVHARWLVGLVFVILITTGGVIWWQWNEAESENLVERRTIRPISQPLAEPCQGQWYDSHLHFNNQDFIAQALKAMNKNQVGCAITLNVEVNPEKDPNIILAEFQESFSPYPGRFIPFFDIIKSNINEADRKQLSKALDSGIAVKGYGESAFYQAPFRETSLLNAPWPDIFNIAEGRNFVVMLHLVGRMDQELATVLKQYPKAKILVHGEELRDKLPDLLKNYPNLFFTIDATTMLDHNSGPMAKLLMYPEVGNDNATAFARDFDTNKEKLLEQALREWLPIIEIAPKQVMWGTDVSMDWHLEPEVYDRLIAFSQDFVGKIPVNYQADYRKNNALSVFGAGITVKLDPKFEQLLNDNDEQVEGDKES